MISALFATGLGFAGPASAHASLLFTSPSAGTAVPRSPTAITLVFDEHVTITAHAVRLASPPDKPVTLGAPSVTTGDGTLSKGGSTLTVAVVHPLAAGTYTVDWQVISDDGDYVSGSYQFGVGSATSGSLSSGTGTSATGLLVPATLARWIQFLALALLLGEAALRRTLHRRHICPVVSSRSWTRWAALAGLIASLLLGFLLAGNGSVGNGFTGPSGAALTSRPGLIVLIEVAAFAVALVVSLRWKRVAWLPATVVIGAEAVRAHPGDYAGAVGTVITAVHLAAAAVLIGALIQALRHLLDGKRDGRRDGRIILAYSGIALWLFVAVVASGTLASLIIVPLHALTGSRYGLTLLVKLALVLAVAGYALRSRRRLHRATVPELTGLRAEVGLVVAILLVSATLTTTAPPRTATTALPIAPAPVGPAIYFGDRAGQLGITVAASAGQVVVHLFAPAVDDPGQPAPDYHLAASLTAPGQSVDRLTVHGCGLGCFVARARWQPGTNRLTLHAGARRWAGGTVTISVPWPPHPDPGALTRLADTLRRTGRLIDNERVTSDTTTGPGPVQAIPITGPQFLATEPYSNGRAAAVDTVTHPDRTTTILIAFPDQDIYAQLELDAAGRPVRERLTDPDHLITRTFTYPETR